MTRANHSADTEASILLAAQQEFSIRGYYGARMQAIADRAKVNKALLHYYFRNKDKLYLRVLEEIIQPFWGNLESQLREQKSYVDCVSQIVRYIITAARKDSTNLIFLQELASGGEFLDKMPESMAHATQVAAQTFLPVFQQAIQQGLVPQQHPFSLFLHIVGMCWNVFLSRPFAEPALKQMGITMDDEYFENTIQSIIALVCPANPSSKN